MQETRLVTVFLRTWEIEKMTTEVNNGENPPDSEYINDYQTKKKPQRAGTRTAQILTANRYKAICNRIASTSFIRGCVMVNPSHPDAAEAFAKAKADAEKPTPMETKPAILVTPGTLNMAVDEAMSSLVECKVNIFQRGHKLVRPIIGRSVDSKGQPVLFPALVEVDRHFLHLMLCGHINWYEGEGKRCHRIDPPDAVAKGILSSAGHWPFRTITGVINTPTLRYDGSILDQPGYDEQTHLFLESGIVLPPIPENPTKAEAERALKLLEGLLAEFPFVDLASRSVALSAMLSAVARSMFDVVPAHGARAPTAGTGKSYLFDIVAAISLGESCPVISVSPDANETEKRIIGAALYGQSLIPLDNVNGTLGGDALCQLIERPVCNLRPLGRSEQVRIENRAIVFFNGNNCRVTGDMTRRVIIAELDAKVEKPAERAFSGDPVAKVKADRSKYIAACMIILRAYIAAGRPVPPKLGAPMNSFGEWSNTVRSALVWLGRADPCDTIATAREEDPELAKASRLYRGRQASRRWAVPRDSGEQADRVEQQGRNCRNGLGLCQSGALRVRAGVHRPRLKAEHAPDRPVAQEVQGTCHLRGRHPAAHRLDLQ